MQLGGWSRFGIVIAVLYGVIVTLLAYDSWPRLEHLHRAWIIEGSEVVAELISNEEGRKIHPNEIRESLLKDDQAINWLEKVATSPSENQKLFSAEVARINSKHKAEIANLSDRQLTLGFSALGLWVGGVALLFSVGWSFGWVYRGFRQNKA